MKQFITSVKSILQKVWHKYRLFVQDAIEGDTYSSDWRERLFTYCIVYSLPFSFLALVPSIIIALQQHYALIPGFDLFTLTTIVLVTLNKRFTLTFRKAYVVVMLYLLAIALIAYLGSFGIGSIYLLALSVLIALMFPSRVTYFSVVVNFLIYTVFGFIIYFKLFHSPLINNYNIGLWIAYSANFLFLNIVVILQIRHVINWLESINKQKAQLLDDLHAEVAEKMQWNELLKESEGHYRSLFFLNPSPMWIYDLDTLGFLQVNDAAIKNYGYSEQDFLNMTIAEIRPKETVDDLMIALEEAKSSMQALSVNLHSRKDGQQFYAEVRCSTIPFKGKEARLVIARNITAQIQYTRAIEKQNNNLQEIAYLQSHIVRAPLARIMALINIISQGHDFNETLDSNIVSYLDISAKELDDVIKAIVNRTEQIVPVSLPEKDQIDGITL